MANIPSSVRPEQATRIRKQQLSYSSNILSFPADIGPHTIVFLFKDYDFRKPGEIGFSTSRAYTSSDIQTMSMTAVELPMPTNLKNSHTIRINPYELGYRGAVTAQKSGELASLQSGDVFNNMNLPFSELVGMSTDMITDFFNPSSMWNAITSADSSKLSRDAAFLLRNRIDGHLNNAVNAGIGSAINGKSALMFDGVDLKSHTFNWVFVPKNSSESELLRSIIRIFEQKSLPAYASLGVNDKAYLKYPSIVEMFLLGINENYFLKFKPSFVRNLEIDYAPSDNLAIIKGGKPAVVNFSVDLLEMNIHTSEDYGGASGDRVYIDEQSFKN